MIATTTATVEGRRITEYRGVIFAHSVLRLGMLDELLDSFKGKGADADSESAYGALLDQAAAKALESVKAKARTAGGDAVVGLRVSAYREPTGNSVIAFASGTAVTTEEAAPCS